MRSFRTFVRLPRPHANAAPSPRPPHAVGSMRPLAERRRVRLTRGADKRRPQFADSPHRPRSARTVATADSGLSLCCWKTCNSNVPSACSARSPRPLQKRRPPFHIPLAPNDSAQLHTPSYVRVEGRWRMTGREFHLRTSHFPGRSSSLIGRPSANTFARHGRPTLRSGASSPCARRCAGSLHSL